MSNSDKPAHAVTSLDVARVAGVSQPTVSLVLGGHAERARVSPDTKRRVLAVAAELNYVPNRLAQSLRSRATKTITVVLPTLQNPFFAEVVSVVQATAELKLYTTNVMVANSDEAERQALTYLAGGAVDAVLLAARPGPVMDQLRRLMDRGVACVVLQGDDVEGIPSIRIDVEAGGYLATRHLVDLGHKRIAHLTEPNASPERFDGYRRALKDDGLPFEKSLVFEGSNTMAGGAAAARALLASSQPRPSALFAYNDLMAVGALHVFRAAGLRVPEDIAVVGFDGTALGGYINPALTTISHERNTVAVDMLFHLLEAGKQQPAMSQTLPVSLTVRQSCGAALKQQRPPDDRTG